MNVNRAQLIHPTEGDLEAAPACSNGFDSSASSSLHSLDNCTSILVENEGHTLNLKGNASLQSQGDASVLKVPLKVSSLRFSILKAGDEQTEKKSVQIFTNSEETAGCDSRLDTKMTHNFSTKNTESTERLGSEVLGKTEKKVHNNFEKSTKKTVGFVEFPTLLSSEAPETAVGAAARIRNRKGTGIPVLTEQQLEEVRNVNITEDLDCPSPQSIKTELHFKASRVKFIDDDIQSGDSLSNDPVSTKRIRERKKTGPPILSQEQIDEIRALNEDDEDVCNLTLGVQHANESKLINRVVTFADTPQSTNSEATALNSMRIRTRKKTGFAILTDEQLDEIYDIDNSNNSDLDEDLQINHPSDTCPKPVMDSMPSIYLHCDRTSCSNKSVLQNNADFSIGSTFNQKSESGSTRNSKIAQSDAAIKDDHSCVGNCKKVEYNFPAAYNYVCNSPSRQHANYDHNENTQVVSRGSWNSQESSATVTNAGNAKRNIASNILTEINPREILRNYLFKSSDTLLMNRMLEAKPEICDSQIQDSYFYKKTGRFHDIAKIWKMPTIRGDLDL